MVVSGSVGFDGTSDKITANSTDFVFGTDDFTIEAKVIKLNKTLMDIIDNVFLDRQ